MGLDLRIHKKPEAKEVFLGLIKQADIWVENLVWLEERYGITDEMCLEVNPKLGIVHVSGYGHPKFGGEVEKSQNRENMGGTKMPEKEFHIVVFIKPVPDMEKVKFDTERGVVDRGSAPLEINPFDLNALEAAVQIKEKLGGEITVVSMAPPAAERVLKDAIARGADRAILLSDKRFAVADTLATSYTLASAIRKLENFDLIICGEKTVDGDTGQVGPEVAEHLAIPHVAYASEIKEVSKERLLLVSELGIPYLVELKLPGLITVTKDVNKPRLPTLKDKLKARKAKIEIWTADNLSDVADVNRFGFFGSPTQVVKCLVPPMKKRKGQIFKGKDAVDKLVEALEKEGILG